MDFENTENDHLPLQKNTGLSVEKEKNEKREELILFCLKWDSDLRFPA